MAEKIACTAAVQGLMQYPGKVLKEATEALMFAQFHDILSGSSIQPVEKASIRLMDHGLELASRVKTKAFFALSCGQHKARKGQIPIMVYNPHPFKIRQVAVLCNFIKVI